MSASAILRTTIVAALSVRPCTTFALAELAGDDPAYHSTEDWNDLARHSSPRRQIHKALDQLRADGFLIVNIHQPGSHRGGLYVMTTMMPCPCLLEFDPDFSVHPRVTLPPIRCGTPGCRAFLARDHILQGGAYCSPCWERRVHVGCLEILGELEQREVTV